MKPSLPKGTRDFLPKDAIRRQYLFEVIASVFRKYGYAPIETPAMENLSTLTGKYGEEGDRLLFKVLNNGDFLDGADTDALRRLDSQALASSIAKRGMRYDLTVPFARFVVMHQNELAFPFKRYQIQPVWRADRPQKGRYQEFYQCDADVVGSPSLLYEAELIQIYDEVFAALGLMVTIRFNHRMILMGVAEQAGVSSQLNQMTVAIDKWDKIGEEGVRAEMEKRGLEKGAIEEILALLQSESLEALKAALKSSSGLQGIDEVEQVFAFLNGSALSNTVSFDPRLARGLDYYTGSIFEVSAVDAEMGSLGGGGRYADLTGVFGLPGTPGVGISFGAERIFDVMDAKNLFPQDLISAPRLLFIALDQASLLYAFQAATVLRKENIAVDVYPEAAKLQKQMRFANQSGAPYVALVGEQERLAGKVTLKDMKTGNQRLVTLSDLRSFL